MTETSPVAYDSKIEGNVIFTQLDAAMNWMRKNSLWPMPMGLACCAIELMAAGASRFDIARFGAEVMRFSPRQSDVMIVAGTVTYKMALAVKRIWDQMPEPKWCIAMGACASSGGMYRCYAVLQGIDQLIPVDVYIAGCPPRPEALIEGLMKLQRKIDGRALASLEQKRDAHRSPAPQLIHGFSNFPPTSPRSPAKFKVLAENRIPRRDHAARRARADPGDLPVLQGELGFTYLLDISGVDNFGEEPRFEVVYELYHFGAATALRLKILVSEDELEVPTVCDIWATADWHEREAYDMYGIKFPRPPGSAPHPHVGRLPVLPAAQGFPARRPPQRHARRGLQQAARRWPAARS